MPEPLHQYALRLHPADDVAIARASLCAGLRLDHDHATLTLSRDIPPGHKLALVPIRAGAPVRRYGQVIGFALSDIAPGDHVHTHNLASRDFDRDFAPCTDARPLPPFPPDQVPTFQGYLRPDGRIGTRNYLAVLSTVNCSASVCRYVAQRFPPDLLRRDFPNVDGIIALTHKGGCTTPPGPVLDALQRVIAGFARHPNVFGYVMIGLGCEGNSVADIRANHRLDLLPPAQPPGVFMNIQHLGGIAKTVDAAAAAVARLLPLANAARRTPQSATHLILAQNCGGSDGNSGITANPALGVASDLLVRCGGTSVLAETPEIYGAEHLLTRRALTPAIADQILAFVHWWKQHAAAFNAAIDNNPSPGNKAGGLTTLFEKSLGAVAKSGQAPFVAAYPYAHPITTPGLCFMDTPGYDPVSMTGLVAGGCNIAVFTTGRGSVYGCKPTPTLKVAATTPLFNHMSDDMDFNAGPILDGTESLPAAGQRLFNLLLATASGAKTKSESQNLGDEEFAPWNWGPCF